MQKVSSYKCPICKKKLSTFSGWSSHMDRFHPNEIPKGYTHARYFYYLQTKKTEGKCIVDAKPTAWNEATQKYERFCSNPKCKEEYRKVFKDRMINKYGKVHLLDNPDMQRKMVSSRRISGSYKFKDGGELGYVGSYEKEFLMMMDDLLNFNSNDIMSPSPHTYYYDYTNPNDKENEGRHFYIPDFYIPSLNLEIEVKSHTNQHHKFQAIDKVKEEAKDVVMYKLPKINYVKVVDKDYSAFFEKLLELKEEFAENPPSKVTLESSTNIESLEGDLANENYVFSDKNVSINLDKFESGKSNMLFITGLSASGKSTLANELASKYNAEVIELDIFEHNNSYFDRSLIKAGDVFKIYLLEKRKDLREKNIKTLSREEFCKEFDMFFDFVITYCKSHKNKKFIIEGVQLFSLIDPDIIKDESIILVNTSVTTSMLRHFKRDIDDKTMDWKNKLEYNSPKLIKWYKDNETKYNAFKKEIMKEGYIESVDSNNIVIANESKMISSNKLYYRDKNEDGDISIYTNQDISNGTILGSLKTVLANYIKISSTPNASINDDNICIIQDIQKHNEITISKSDRGKLDNVYTAESLIEICNSCDYSDTIVQESIFDIFKSINTSKEAILGSWKNKLLAPKNAIGQVLSNKFDMVSLINKGQYIQIQNINIRRLINTINEKYGEVSLAKLFILNYNSYDYKRFKKKRIARGRMRIVSLNIPIFFALEAIILFDSLYQDYDNYSYRLIAQKIYDLTWVSKADKAGEMNTLSLKNLKRIDRKELLPYQKEFIELYPILKAKLNLRGYINAFEQGLGKTLTAIGLAECLNVKRVYIVCPNTLKDNWALEIKDYYSKYYDNEELWKQEVVICDNNIDSSKARFLITNNESISKMLSHVTDEKESMFILDESHNFRNLNGQRVTELLELVKKIDCNNNLIMSGTPIKAIPNEIIPALLIIDPLFTMEAADIYNKCFNISSTAAMEIVQKRFGMVIYRKTKSELQLPDKEIHQISFKLSDSDKYTVSNCKEDVVQLFYEIYEEKMKDNEDLQKEYLDFINKYSSADTIDTERYIRWVKKSINTDAQTYLHELDMAFMKSFVTTYVKPNITNKEEYKRVDRLEKEFIHMDRSAMGLAIGKVIHPRRTEMFIRLYNENKDEIINMIEDNNKKVVIFSQFEKVAEFIANDLNKEGIKTLLITGKVKTNRTDTLIQFREDDMVQVLVATSQTMSTGVTLTEANKMFFFGPPWRSTDFDQASDRIHRIGQTSKVDIYLVSLDTGEKKNLATRMLDILNWSQDMFESAIKEESSMDGISEVLESSLNYQSYNIYDFQTKREGLDDYLKFNIISKHNGRTDGHGIPHINEVLVFSDKLASKVKNVDRDICLTVAAYHDIGMLKEDRKNHHINSAKYVEKDRKNLLKWFTNEEIDIIKAAVLEHRSSDTAKRSSIYSYIVCDADESGIVDIHDTLKRSWDYNLTRRESNDTDLTIFNKVFHHMNERYGTYGFTEFHLNETKIILKESIKRLHQVFDSKELAKEVLLKLYADERIQILDDGTLFENEKYKITESYSSIVGFLNNYYDRSNDVVLESSVSDEKKYPIFLVLMHSGTALANAIKAVTKDKFSHACISFSVKLNPLYSFGRKDLDMTKTGFVANSPKDRFFTKFKAYYSVYVIYVTKQDLDNMKSRLDFFIENENKLRYDVKGLLLNYVQLPNENQKKYFCSRFVGDILSSGKIIDKSPSLYRPNDFVYLKDVIKIDEGDDFYKYDWKVAFNNLNKINKGDEVSGTR